MQPTLILASTSPYRATLVNRLGLPFGVEAPGVDEASHSGEPPPDRALRLARNKAAAVAARFPDAWVIGSDQVAECRSRIHDKPGDERRCREQLQASSGQAVLFHTAVVLCRQVPFATSEHLDRTTVRFRELDAAEIAAYVERDRPFDCAGGFRVEGLGITLFTSVESRDPTALIGLPLIWLAAALRSAGFALLEADQP